MSNDDLMRYDSSSPPDTIIVSLIADAGGDFAEDTCLAGAVFVAPDHDEGTAAVRANV